MSNTWKLGPDCGELLVKTDVAGPAAKAGHRLTIGFDEWSGQVEVDDDVPRRVELRVVVDSLQVLRGEGGLTPLSGPERSVARGNALKSLQAKKYREIAFDGDSVVAVEGGYRVSGTLSICGRSAPHSVDVGVEQESDGWRVSSSTTVRHSDVGLKPFSLMMGTLKVADAVGLEFSATVTFPQNHT